MLGRLSARGYAQKTAVRTTKLPLRLLGVMADFYIPPKFIGSPLTLWPRLLWRRAAHFGLNTYGAAKFKMDTKKPLEFNAWKEQTVEKYVTTNKVFALACSMPLAQREDHIKKCLEGVCNVGIQQSLVERARTFPARTKVEWRLKEVVGNPKVVSFVNLPDQDDVTMNVSLVVRLVTKQEMVVTPQNRELKTTARQVEDHVVAVLDPYTRELIIVGTLFRSNHERNVMPQVDANDIKAFMALQKTTADIYRANV